MTGYLALIFHAHIPYVRDLEHEDSLEQRWLFEAITETYIPLLLTLDNLAADGIDFRLTVSITPTLASMLADPLLQSRYLARLELLNELAEKEIQRTRSDPRFAPLARLYREIFARVHDAFVNRYKKNMLAAFHRLQSQGSLEIIASAATHGYLPLLSVNESAVRSQIRVGLEHYRQVFGQPPTGFWLPECGYFPGVDDLLNAEGLRFTILETHGITRADQRPRYGVHAPLYCPSGVAVFGRDPDCSRQVWSSVEGYPGDFEYREFYRDIGYDLDLDYVKPYIYADGSRADTGIKYHRITGKGDRKEPYEPEAAERKAEIHAEHFLAERIRQVDRLWNLMDRSPIVVAPYDAELFGHWWFEGPKWLDHLIRKIAGQHTVRLTTLSEYLKEHPVNQIATPSMSSWGLKGFNEFWLNKKNDWIYPHLHAAGDMMDNLAVRYSNPARVMPAVSRALNQAARELLLAQASDWPFMIASGTMREYASRQVKTHLARFYRLKEQVERGVVDERWLEATENENNLFSGLSPFAAFSMSAIAVSPAMDVPATVPPQEERPVQEVSGLPEQPHIVMVCPELVPFAKTGGLADMIGALAPALEQLGHRVSIIMPAYASALRSDIALQEPGVCVTARVDGRMEAADVLYAAAGKGIRVYFIRADRYFNRAGLYGTSEGDYPDNLERFVFFSRAALEVLGTIGPTDVLHAHDWQAALAIAFLKAQPERYPGIADTPTVLTVHNLGYQGLFSPGDWRVLDLDSSYFRSEWLEFYGRINLLKGGLVFADAITTVSPTYAQEIRTAEGGFGLEGIFQKRARNLVGILNGVDYRVWDPATDPFIVRNFSPEDTSGKLACKADVQVNFNLPQKPDVPLLAIVSRLAGQKGLDLLESVLDRLLQKDLQFVLLGSGEKRYETYFQAASLRYPGKVGVHLSFNEALAHKIEAGADIFLMPSLYEPSGLNQLYSMKYGTIPVVRATGGLKDSVEEFDPLHGTGSGFLFESYNGEAFLDAIDRAVSTFLDKSSWKTLMKNAMTLDYSWSHSARKYAALYKELCCRRALMKL